MMGDEGSDGRRKRIDGKMKRMMRSDRR